MVELGRVGVWSGLRSWDAGAVGAAAAAVESSGYGALWIPGGAGGDVLDRCRAALDATTDLVVATGILNIWRHDAREVAAETASLRAASGDRFVLGLGVSHERLIGEEYVAPLAKMRSYLDELDGTGQSPDVHYWEFNSHSPDGKPVDVTQRAAMSRHQWVGSRLRPSRSRFWRRGKKAVRR